MYYAIGRNKELCVSQHGLHTREFLQSRELASSNRCTYGKNSYMHNSFITPQVLGWHAGNQVRVPELAFPSMRRQTSSQESPRGCFSALLMPCRHPSLCVRSFLTTQMHSRALKLLNFAQKARSLT